MSLRKCSSWILVTAVSCGIPGYAVPGEATSSDQDRARAAAIEAEKTLVKVAELSKQGAVPSASVEEAEIDLARARIELASMQDNDEEIVGNLEKIVALRERQWKRATDLAERGAVSRQSVGDARIEWAEARIWLDRQTIALVRGEQLKQLEEEARRGGIARRTLEEGRKTLDDARHRLERDRP